MHNVFGNKLLEDSCLWLVARWGTGTSATLRLFRNDLEPTPATEVAEFLEANWGGYTPISLLNQLAVPTLAQDGDWESTTAKFVFVPPAIGVGNRIYGCYITLGGFLEAAQRFVQPFDMVPGANALRIRVNPHVKSGSLFEVT